MRESDVLEDVVITSTCPSPCRIKPLPVGRAVFAEVKEGEKEKGQVERSVLGLLCDVWTE